MDATAWALVALIIFIALVAYLKVPGMVTRALDSRADTIRAELDEARRLREEAQQLLAEYQRKRKDAEKEAADMVASAEREAKAITREAKEKTEEYVARRTAMAEEKIAKAESDAVAEVRASAVNLAVAAAERIIRERADDTTRKVLFDQSVAELKQRMN
jgi:F-type H+-transporting ATPase subunit b